MNPKLIPYLIQAARDSTDMYSQQVCDAVVKQLESSTASTAEQLFEEHAAKFPDFFTPFQSWVPAEILLM